MRSWREFLSSVRAWIQGCHDLLRENTFSFWCWNEAQFQWVPLSSCTCVWISWWGYWFHLAGYDSPHWSCVLPQLTYPALMPGPHVVVYIFITTKPKATWFYHLSNSEILSVQGRYLPQSGPGFKTQILNLPFLMHEAELGKVSWVHSFYQGRVQQLFSELQG